MKKAINLLILLSLSCPIYTNNHLDSNSFLSNNFNVQEVILRLDYLSIDIKNETNMGLIGAHYLLDFNNTFYGGIGMYGAITGEKGGFFTLGRT